ncbi:guanine nucleotide binding (G protein), alpha [Puccinia sorghi]|uniref:Guanine nucleotide binding (G protein), alpha n=1 Tax=Puccinia sorghi TaxID=27349 RepID=A0A0L6USF5_9BASI|nr:guanine nucleotide binding (G protein), alpha [Puccinia sorghi]
MGNCYSTFFNSDPEHLKQVKASKNIDKSLKEDEKQMTKEVKILLLGAGESGKTTVLKQMQIVHNRGGFSSSQKEHYRQQVSRRYLSPSSWPLDADANLIPSIPPPNDTSKIAQVFINICEGMRLCLEVMSKEEIELENVELMVRLRYLYLCAFPPFFSLHTTKFVPMFNHCVDLEPGQPFPAEYLEPLSLFWVDGGIRKAVDSGNEWALPEKCVLPRHCVFSSQRIALHSFYPELDRLFHPSYVPSDLDILHCRGKTTGITETTFNVSELTYRSASASSSRIMFDVGGQRSERKKWIHCFEGVTAVLFLVAISGYDARLLEDGDANQMQEALMLFDTITNSQWFTQTSMILFLNKTDLFKQKLCYSPISKHFPGTITHYQGEDTDYEAARSYFKDRFVRLNRSTKKEIYTHYTCATDTSLMRVVMASVTDIIITRNLQSIIL